MDEKGFLKWLALNTADTIVITRDPIIAQESGVKETDLFLEVSDSNGMYIHLILLPKDAFSILKDGERFTIKQLLNSYTDMERRRSQYE